MDDGQEREAPRFDVTDDLMVMRPDGTSCEVGEVGMLARSGWIPLGYLGDPEKTAATFKVVDGKRWVIWTPKGHYLASPGGEDLFGWHVPRGASHSADFFAGSRLRATLLRPDVIARVLASADLDSAVREADLAANRPAAPPSAK